MRGITGGFEPQMLDVTSMVKFNWVKMSEETIFQFWMMAIVSPKDFKIELNDVYGHKCIDYSGLDV